MSTNGDLYKKDFYAWTQDGGPHCGGQMAGD